MDREKKEVVKAFIPCLIIWLIFEINFNEQSILAYLAPFASGMVAMLFFYKPNGKNLKLDSEGFITAVIGSGACGFIVIIISSFFNY